jgi:exodeoxyribonuclease VII small subunit
MTKKISYQSALKRIEEIIDQVENGEPDVDTLTDLVKEATSLIEACKEKLNYADIELSETLKKLS